MKGSGASETHSNCEVYSSVRRHSRSAQSTLLPSIWEQRVAEFRWQLGADDHITLQTVYRFPNAPVQVEQHLYWDLAQSATGCSQESRSARNWRTVRSTAIGVDGWAVDYVRLNQQMQPLADPFCYRDTRTESRQLELWKKIPRERIYALTGIQHLRFNTLYQLYADRCDHLSSGHRWLTLPEYMLSFLGRRARSGVFECDAHADGAVSEQENGQKRFSAPPGLDQEDRAEDCANGNRARNIFMSPIGQMQELNENSADCAGLS